jgi:hypothetical protein
MAAQDVRELIPRVRRAIEGPVPLSSGALSDAQVEALAADCIADIILLTEGLWGHELAVSEVDDTTGYPEHWTVDPGLSLPEESLVAAQAAVQYFIYTVKEGKTSERIKNESREWEWQKSPTLLKDWFAELVKARDAALETVTATNPPMARYASILAVREPFIASLIEPWSPDGMGMGGQRMLT